jgi:hypothetical protein
MPLGGGIAFESPYVYASNLPVVLVDPSGLRPVSPTSATVDVLHPKDRTTQHNQLVAIELAYCAAKGERCQSGLVVPGGSKKGTGKDGFADIVHNGSDGPEVAEVKSWSEKAKVLPEASWYASKLPDGRIASTWDARVWSTGGGFVVGGRPFTYTAVPGGFVYKESKGPNPRVVPVPVPSPAEEPDLAPGSVPGPVVVAGGAAAVGGTIWWLGKLAAPACGPAVLVCAVVL